MSLILNRLGRLGVWTRFGLVVLLALVSVVMNWCFPNLGIIWTPSLVGIMLACYLLPRTLAIIAAATSAASLLTHWYLVPRLASNSLSQPFLSEVVQLLLFLGIVAWTVQTVAQKLRFLEAVAEGTEEYVYLIDAAGTVTYVNEVVARGLGYPREEVIGRPFARMVPAWYYEEAWALLRAGLASRQPRAGRITTLTRSGEELTVSVTVRAFAVNGEMQLLGVGRNVTGAERTERLFTAAFDAYPDPAVIRDRDGQILACNEAYARSLGKSKAEVTGLNLPPHGLTAAQLPGWNAPGTSIRPDCPDVQIPGGRTVQMQSSPILDDRGAVVASLTMMPDVTAKRGAEARMVQAAQLAAVGQVAAGAAHNINNVLAAISVSAELLNLDAGALGPIVSKDILSAVAHGSSIVRRLYGLAGRGERPKLEPLSANEMLRGVLKLVQPQFTRKGIGIVVEAPAELLVLGDSSQLNQVLLNLMINALHAMTDGGTLTLRAVAQGAMVDLVIADTGHGILPEHMNHLFTPFFTTKTTDQGTGLGLPTSLHMVRAMHGEILVDSHVGSGSAFTVRLPAAPRPREG